jgi:hypothetical protein
MEYMGRLDGKTLVVFKPVGNPPHPLPLPIGERG